MGNRQLRFACTNVEYRYTTKMYVFMAAGVKPSTYMGITVVQRRARISRKCIRAPAIQSMLRAEWCTAWNFQSQGRRWNARWTQYCTKSVRNMMAMNCTTNGNAPTQARTEVSDAKARMVLAGMKVRNVSI